MAVTAGYGFETALSMSPRQLAAVAQLYDRRSRHELILDATATRLGMTDKKGWEKTIKDIGDGE